MKGFRYSGVALLFVLHLFAGCSTDIITGIDEAEANQLLVVLSENNIRANKVSVETEQGVLWNVRVRRRDFLKALQILSENNLPEEKTEGVVEIFGKKSFLPTQTAERVLEEYSRNAELSKTLEQIQGVVKARVHIAKMRDELTGAEKPVSASVLINYIARNGGEKPFSTDDIRKIISGGVANLLEENVNVVAVPVLQRSIKPPEGSSSLSFLFFFLCGIFLLVSGGFNLYLWTKFKAIVLKNGKGDAVPDRKETEKGNE